MIQKILLIILTVLVLQSCKWGAVQYWKNGKIDKDKREQIKLLNDKIIKDFINDDVNSAKLLMSDKLLEKGAGDLDNLFSQSNKLFKTGTYTIVDEYYVYNTTTGIANTLLSGISGDNDYVISYQPLTKEVYVSLLLPVGLNNDILVTVIYGKYKNDWKINVLQVGQYSLFKKTAPYYYKLAKACYDKSYLIDAVNYIGLSKKCSTPANRFFHYQKDKEINDFYDRVMKEINAKFQLPLTLGNISSKPKVFRIYPEMINEGFFPMVQYLSTINLKDTTALKVENLQVKKEIDRLFTGIDKDKKFVLYQAFNEFPDGKKSVRHYGFVDKL